MKELKQEKLKTNFVFQTIYYIVISVLPMLVAPYLTRTLGDNLLGNYVFVNSIAAYFVEFANLGISRHGQRLLASCNGDKEEIRKNFWSLYIDHAFVSILSIILYLICLNFFFKDYSNIYWIQLIYVGSALFDVTWLFYGLQSMKIVSLVNLFVRILTSAMVFLFVKSSNDFLLYVFIASFAILLPNLFCFGIAIAHYPFIDFEKTYLFKHWKPLLILSLSVIASTLYTTFDKTIIGLYLEKNEVAYYEYANKILNIPKSLIGVIGVVMYPKICMLISEKNNDKAIKLRSFSIDFVSFLSLGAVFGLYAISFRFINLYYGSNFFMSSNYLKMMTPLIYLVLLGDIFRSQCLIPMKKDWVFISSLFVSAIINLVLNFILIRSVGVLGVIIGSLCAEGIGTLYQWFFSRKYVDNKEILKSLLFFSLDGILMYFCIYLIGKNIANDFAYIIVSVIVGLMVYSIISVLFFFLISSNKKMYRAKIISWKIKKNKKDENIKN